MNAQTKVPLISVYIPTFNRPDVLKKAVDSVLNQTYPNVEILVVNDGDTLPEQISYYLKNNNVIQLRTQGRQGACVARNKAIVAATGEYITGLDDDDTFTPERLAEFYYWTAKHGDACLFTNYIYVETDKRKKRRCNYSEIDENIIFQGNFINNQVFAPKRFFVDSGLFDESLPAWQDYDMWIRMIKNFGPAVLLDNYSYIMDGSADIRISKSPVSVEKAITIFIKKYPEYQQEKYLAYAFYSKQTYYSIAINWKDFWLMFKHLNKISTCRLLWSKTIYRLFKVTI
jgi:glycosyltransferase involved in cell wall biosynthesis